jgi:Rrf2 family protein
MIIGTMPRQVEYALMALSEMHLANPGQLFSARELCDKHHIPFDVLSKAMQRLGRAGILRSVKGLHGGYQVNKDLSTVSLLDLMQAVLGDIATVNCLKDGGGCPRLGVCNVSAPMQLIDQKLRELYDSLSIQGLISVDPNVSCGG